jgi:hypothetical protein
LTDRQIEWVERQLLTERTARQCPLKQNVSNQSNLNWTAKIVDYVEWIYALHAILVHFGSNVTLRRLFDVFNKIFGMEVKDYYIYYSSIKNRKKGDRTSLLDLEKQLVIEKMEESDSKPAKRLILFLRCYQDFSYVCIIFPSA